MQANAPIQGDDKTKHDTTAQQSTERHTITASLAEMPLVLRQHPSSPQKHSFFQSSRLSTTSYLDNILEVYPLPSARPERLNDRLRRRDISAPQGRRTRELLDILQNEVKFPYDEPLWFLINNIQGFLENNPQQIQRIAD